MASRKKLKKAIHIEIEEMLFDLSVLHSIAPEDRRNEIELLIVEIINMEHECIAKISHTDGKGEPRIVRKYYRELVEHYEQFAQKISESVERLFREIAAPEQEA